MNPRDMIKFRCTLCNYVYNPFEGAPDDGIPAGTPWEEVPEDWQCPLCGAGKEDFVEVIEDEPIEGDQ